jgi:hypothetical protein
MRRLCLAAAFALIASAAQAASLSAASEGYIYFNKPGSDALAHDADVRECRLLASGLHQPNTHPAVYAPGLAGAIGAAIAMAIIQAADDARARPVNLENCMVAKGWRVVAMTPAAGEAADKLDAPAKAALIKPLIGAAEPEGTVVRSFENDVARPGTSAMFSPAIKATKASLSVETLGEPPEDKKKPSPATSTRWAKALKPLKPDQLGEIPKGMGLVVVNLQGGSLNIGFEQVAQGAADAAGSSKKTTSSDVPAAKVANFVVAYPAKATVASGGPAGLTLVFAAPPGEWRMAELSAGLFEMSLCLGSPSFKIAAGEVIFAGAFQAGGTETALGPDMTPDPYRSVFPALSGLGEKMKPAEYMNGSTSKCAGAYLYAFEMPDRPFAESYRHGSRALPAKVAAVAAVAPQAAAPAAISATSSDSTPPATSVQDVGVAPTAASPAASSAKP